MTNQEKKEFLMRYRQVQAEVSQLLLEREEIMAMGTRISPTYSGQPKGPAGGDKIQMAVQRSYQKSPPITKCSNRYQNDIILMHGRYPCILYGISCPLKAINDNAKPHKLPCIHALIFIRLFCICLLHVCANLHSSTSNVNPHLGQCASLFSPWLSFP